MHDVDIGNEITCRNSVHLMTREAIHSCCCPTLERVVPDKQVWEVFSHGLSVVVCRELMYSVISVD